MFTGKFKNMNRYEAAQKVVNRGGKCYNHYWRGIDMLIAGDNKGKISRKLKIAIEKGIEVISEQDLYKYILLY
ncbi:MAG: hypothetical protein A2Y29_00625 [Spirochaetes bacterium GWE2_31_10]|nr:MAG: hypothetical protein A2Y29_00625 [Spirochaetes bacterium GWE2_31_10]